MLRIVQVALGNLADLRRHGRGEQRDLPLRWCVLQDPLDVIDETHTQHLVRLVEHQCLQARDIQGAATHMVHDASRRPDHHLDSAAQLVELHAHPLPAVDRQHVEAGQEPRIGLHRLGNLQGQLTRRRQYQQLRMIGRRVDACEQRQRKGGSLAGPGLGLADHVTTVQQHRDGLGLDR